MILALDLGTKTGWALGNGKRGHINSGVWNLVKGKPASRYQKLIAHVQLEYDAAASLRVVYEKVMGHVGTRAAHVYGAFEAYLEDWCAAHDVALTGVGVGTIKKHATGHGRATKAEMKSAATARGWSVIDDNHADALWLLDYAIKEGK